MLSIIPCVPSLFWRRKSAEFVPQAGLEMLVAQAKYAVEIFLDTHLEDTRIAEINTPLLKERSNLVLVGMSGGGKSTIGKRAAEKLGKGFVDTDDLIIERIKMPIAEFFAKEGEPAFREIETKVIHEVSSQNNLVIATGGGIIKNPLNVEYLKRNGRLIWLKRDADLLQTGNGRPLAPIRRRHRSFIRNACPFIARRQKPSQKITAPLKKVSQLSCRAMKPF